MACTNTAVFAALPRTERGRGVILGGDPKGKTFLYTNGHSVIIRDISNPAVADVYTEHATPVNVAKYSPSGFYIASGDQGGRIRIWDTTNKEHILKNEFPIFAGPIRDLSWSSDSQRIVVGGEGRERFGHVFAADTGTSVGEIGGPSKPLNTVDFKPSRPFRIITASEDGGVTNFAGPPFKFEKTCSDHLQSFVNCARYDSKGDKFASCGSDGRIFIYDGKSAEKLSELCGEGANKHAHEGGIYSICWTPDGKHILSASGDKTCKLWDVEAGTAVTTFTLGKDQQDMQLGCLCQGDHLLSVSAAGFINYLDKSNPAKPLRILQGHVKPVTAVCAFNGSIYSGASDATITKWNGTTGEHERVGGLSNTGGHQNQIVRLLEDLATSDANNDHAAISVGMDDVARCIAGNQFIADYSIQTGTTPTGAATVPGKNLYVIVNAANEVLICNRASKSIVRTKLPYGALCVAVRPKPVDSDMKIAIGGDDQKTHLYSVAVDGSALDAKNELASFEHMGQVTDVAFSPCGTYLAAADTNRKVHVFKIAEADGKTVLERALPKSIEWGAHTARVNSIAWSPNSKRLASGSLDTQLCIWSIDSPKDKIMVKNAHRMAGINGVAWLDDKTVVTGAHDGNLKLWKLS